MESITPTIPTPPAAKASWLLTLSALGVVFGDIGTSPLYTFNTALQQPILQGPDLPLGIASLIIWSLLFIVTFKYILLVMKADYHGEGGIFTLLALLGGKDAFIKKTCLPFLILVILSGAALLYGDGAITPAISVLSALEGLQQVYPSLASYIVPITVVILLLLFSAQRFGTGRLGKIFGMLMVAWFFFLGISGLFQIMAMPSVLCALNPYYAWKTIVRAGPTVFFLLSAIVLAVTGVEALYADMGHFGRKSIARAWSFVVLPCLTLNYLGQAAIALQHPLQWKENIFFMLVPHGYAMLALVVLATVATIIASQALISGVFSLTAQARDLDFLPRFLVLHTNRFQRGQVYLPTINWLLASVCLLLVCTFQSSTHLAAAYGLAVIGTMSITSLSFSVLVVRVWHYPRWVGVGVMVLLSSVELPFLISSLTKFSKGGWIPLTLATCLMTIMLTWHRGRTLLRKKMLAGPCSLEGLIEKFSSSDLPILSGTQVIISPSDDFHYGIARAFESMRREGCRRKQLILLSLVGISESHVFLKEQVEVTLLAPSLYHITAYFGYMQQIHVPEILSRVAPQLAYTLVPEETFFFLPHETVVEYEGKEMPLWRQKLFGWLSRNMSYAPDYFFIPYSQIVEFYWMMKL